MQNLNWVSTDRAGRSPESIAKRVNFFAQRIAARKYPANMTVSGGGKFEWGGMGEKCQHCDRPAYVRWRRVVTGEIVSAACRKHEGKARP